MKFIRQSVQHQSWLSVVAMACLSTSVGGCFPGGAPVDTDGLPTTTETAKCVEPEDEAILADQVLQLINLERTEAGLSPVVLEPKLSKVANAYACKMIENDFFEHLDPLTGRGPADRAIAQKYTFFAIGENLASGATTAAEVMELWMASPAHQAIILDQRWKEVGIGVRVGGKHGIYWIQEFGDPADF